MTEKHSADALDELLAPYACRNEEDLDRWLIEPGTPPELAAAMRYSASGQVGQYHSSPPRLLLLLMPYSPLKIVMTAIRGHLRLPL